MTLYVVGSSVTIKWYVPEDAAEADRLRARGGFALHAPDLSEIAAIAWKKIRRDECRGPMPTSSSPSFLHWR